MALVIHPTVKHVAPIYEKEVILENTKTILLGNKEACRKGEYDSIISFIDPDDIFEQVQENHIIFRIYDHSTSPIETIFPEFLTILKKSKGRILVHCGEGISRSPSFLLGYLIIEKNMSFESALETLQTIRPTIKPNRGFTKFLKRLESGKVGQI